jgi:nudix-type nucleoside diphosphatase (YffH/AdpP family)
MKIEEVQVLYEGFETHALASVRHVNGTIHRYVVNDHGDAAAVLPFDPVRKVALLVQQHRAPLAYRGEDSLTLELPAGIVEPLEDYESAARRETYEETGLEIVSLDSLGHFWTMPGLSTERAALYTSTYSSSDRIALGGGLAAEGEAITVVELPLAKLATMADDGKLPELKLFAAVQTLRLKRPDLFI